MAIRFTWDEKKAAKNLRDHKISFETAKNVFFDPHLLVIEDSDRDDEVRYHAIGFANGSLFVVVVYIDLSENDEEEVVRIISARKGETFEEKLYAKQLS